MKKLLLFASGIALCGIANAQQVSPVLSNTSRAEAPTVFEVPTTGIINAKVTKNGDTILKSNLQAGDSLRLYVGESVLPRDTGYVAGVNIYGDKGFAERFDIKSPDSTVQPLGAAIYFAGTAATGTSKSVRVVAWAQGPTTKMRTNLFATGMPGTVLNSVTIPLASLRKANGRIDSFRLFRFATPAAYVADSFFVGYDMTYSYSSLNGDTVACYMTQNGARHQPGYVLKGADTLINVQNATQSSAGTWTDNLNGGRYGLYNQYIMYALYKVKITTGVNNGVTRNDLTVFGTVPNPANNAVSLKLSLKTGTDVSVQIVDVTGRLVTTLPMQHLQAGAHNLPINTSTFASGTYYCMIRTAQGDAMGIEMVIAK